MNRRVSVLAACLLALLALGLAPAVPSSAQAAPDPAGPDVAPTPRAQCGPGSHPETGAQGRVPKAEVDSGRAAEGYRCNAVQVAHVGETGGYKVERYVDKAGRECAYYDTTLLFPLNVTNLSGGDLTGVAVLDMSDPSKPVKTTTLVTPAMQSPHESMALNHKRGLLAAVTANPVFYPGIVDVYDVSQDCRNPVLKASAPVGVLGHESGFAPDGNTFYVAALHAPVVVAVDVTNPMVPTVLGTYDYYSHGISISDDGNRMYMAANGRATSNTPKGLVVLDSSEIQARKLNPKLPIVSKTTWALVSTPQINLPVTIDGHPYLVEMDEFRGDPFRVGAARIIDIADEKNPKVVSNLRLEVNQAAAHEGEQAGDYGTGSLQNYTGHYCNVPSRVDPGIVACTFIVSGLRVFDIRDPHNPKEIAYFNGPIEPGDSAYAMSSPSFVPERGEIWYSDGNSGFYAVRLTNGVWPFERVLAAGGARADGAAEPGASVASGTGGGGKAAPAELPATGMAIAAIVPLIALAVGFAMRRLMRRRQ
ncbi:MAG TPA: hypothetical protein VF230_05410 [Acidimicrobiales bacterium]